MRSDAPLPEGAVLHRFQAAGAFVDCYRAELRGSLQLADFIAAFYTTRLFKAERLVLAALAWRPSSDVDAQALARGERDRFAVWTVEQRHADQILLADASGRTRSWLMAVPAAPGAYPASTLLYFGSALLPRVDPATGAARFGPLFSALLGVHRRYSRALLAAAVARLAARHPRDPDA